MDLSINPEIAVASGEALFLPKEKTYLTFDEMIKKEAALPANERMDFVTIVTPNFAHFAPAMMALDFWVWSYPTEDSLDSSTEADFSPYFP